MITHAAYHAENPLPAFRAPLWIEHGQEPPVVGRVHLIAVPADAAPKVVSVDDVLSALSQTEWRGVTRIAEAIGVAAQTAGEKLASAEVKAVTERRVNGCGGRHEWRLL